MEPLYLFFFLCLLLVSRYYFLIFFFGKKINFIWSKYYLLCGWFVVMVYYIVWVVFVNSNYHIYCCFDLSISFDRDFLNNDILSESIALYFKLYLFRLLFNIYPLDSSSPIFTLTWQRSSTKKILIYDYQYSFILIRAFLIINELHNNSYLQNAFSGFLYFQFLHETDFVIKSFMIYRAVARKVISSKHTSINIRCITGDCYNCTPCICISSGRWFELMTRRATALYDEVFEYSRFLFYSCHVIKSFWAFHSS